MPGSTNSEPEALQPPGQAGQEGRTLVLILTYMLDALQSQDRAATPAHMPRCRARRHFSVGREARQAGVQEFSSAEQGVGLPGDDSYLELNY